MNFVKSAYIFLSIILVTVLLSIGIIYHKRFNLGLDFTGGFLIEISGDINDKLLNNIKNISQVNIIKSGNSYIIKQHANDIKNAQDVVTNITQIIKQNPNVKILRSDIVGSQFSDDILIKSIISIILSILAIYLYMWLKFGVKLASGAVLALVQNCLFALGICAFLQIEINLMIISALLTIIGYCINDTVVVFDRIKQVIINNRNISQENAINAAMRLVIKRSIITSSVTSLAICPLLFVSSSDITSFTIVILSGIFVGTFTSIFLSAIMGKFCNINMKIPKQKSNIEDPMRYV